MHPTKEEWRAFYRHKIPFNESSRSLTKAERRALHRMPWYWTTGSRLRISFSMLARLVAKYAVYMDPALGSPGWAGEAWRDRRYRRAFDFEDN
jgi:hypothetical protein